jgi:serine/threonine-protein kinase RsbW
MKDIDDHISLEFMSNLKFTAFSVIVLGYIKNFLKINEDDFFKIEMALREVINNAIVHGNKSDLDKKVFVKFKWKKSRLQISVKDENPERVNFTKINEKIRKNNLLSFSGRGILIMKSYMDKVEFKASNQGSEIVMVKNL